MPSSTGGPSPRRSVMRKLTPPRATCTGNSHGTQQATGGERKPEGNQNWPWAMPTTTLSPCALAQAGMVSPERGARKGSGEKPRSRRPSRTRWPLSPAAKAEISMS